jgi:hypothetical protein
MVPTSTTYIYNTFSTINMVWMGRWIHHHAVVVDAEFGAFADFLDDSKATNDVKVHWLVEAPDPHGMVPTSTKYI